MDKHCTSCGEKDNTKFYPKTKTRCKVCINKYKKKYRKLYPEKSKKIQNDWFKTQYAPENRLKYRLMVAKSRAKRHNISCNIELEDLENLIKLQNNKCIYTGIEFTNTAEQNIYSVSIDRIDSNLGYVKGNIQLVLQIINFMKQQYSEELFTKMCKKVYLNSIS